MTLLHNIWFSKLHILYNLTEAISLPSFIGLGFSGSNFTRGGEKHLSPDLHTLKKPSPYGVKQMKGIAWVKYLCMQYIEGTINLNYLAGECTLV